MIAKSPKRPFISTSAPVQYQWATHRLSKLSSTPPSRPARHAAQTKSAPGRRTGGGSGQAVLSVTPHVRNRKASTDTDVFMTWKPAILSSMCMCCADRWWCDSRWTARYGTRLKMATLDAMTTAVTHSVVRAPVECAVPMKLATVMAAVEAHATRKTTAVARALAAREEALETRSERHRMSDGSHARDTPSLCAVRKYSCRKSTVAPATPPSRDRSCRRISSK
mmetsp:Transcript_12983/g.42504  ORF Transcript_12983/g.42504 Transcript_12983/m.42504 type:complete len:223 (+) Transcript_12983:868-1536(+)